jgi:hypothetical protein
MTGYGDPQSDRIEASLARIEARLATLSTGTGGGTADTTRPVVQNGVFSAITTSESFYDFAVTCTDNAQVSVAAIGTTGITVTGPSSFSKNPTLLNTAPSTNAASVTANYRVAGAFTAGTYTVTAAAAAFTDASGNTSLAKTVGTFVVGAATGGNANVGGSGPAAGVNVDFEALSAVPSDWTAPAGVATIRGDGLIATASASTTSQGWFFNTYSPVFSVEEGRTIEIEFRDSFEFGAVGLVGVTGGAWGTFASANALMVQTANGSPASGSLHDGQNAIQSGIAIAAPPGYSRLTVTFNITTMLVVLETETAPGVFAQRYSQTRPIPAAFYNGIQIVLAPFSGEMVLRKVTSTSVNTNPVGVVSQRTVPSTFFGYNGSSLDIDNWDTVNMASVGQSLIEIGSNVIRFPGGDESNFWDQSGLYQDTESTVPLAPWHFHGLALPIWIAYQTSEQTATRANYKRMFDAANAGSLVYVVNCTTSTPAQEVTKIQDLISRGFPLEALELGNELYFGVPYYTGDGNPASAKYLRGHTSALAYCNDMKNNYVPALRAAFGNTYKIGVPAFGSNFTSGSRENEWNSVILSSGLGALVDLYIVHPYYNITDIGLQKSDVGNTARAGEIGKAAYTAMQNVLRFQSLAILGDNAKFFVTEFNVLEDQSQTAFVALGQSWLHGLIQCQNMAMMLRDKRIDQALVHSMLGNSQWSGLVGEDGTNVDPAKRGIQDNPFTTGYSPPLTPTLSGIMMGLFQRRVLSGGGQGNLLTDTQGYMAWRVNNVTRDAIAIINATAETKTFTTPADKTWSASRWTAAPWISIVSSPQFPSAVVSSLGANVSTNIPAFSLVILTGSGSTPADSTPPTVTVTGYTDRAS